MALQTTIETLRNMTVSVALQTRQVHDTKAGIRAAYVNVMAILTGEVRKGSSGDIASAQAILNGQTEAFWCPVESLTRNGRKLDYFDFNA